MSSDEDDLFGGSDSDDTAELLAASKSTTTKKKPAPPKKDDSDDDGGLFDSDSEDEAPPQKKLSKKEKLEALARKKKPPPPQASSGSSKPKKSEDGYESGNSYDSETFERTAEDDAFIDTTGEDADAVNELYAEQNFNDERPAKEKKKKRRKRQSDDDEEAEPDNPIMAAVHRMKKKKRVKKSGQELEDEIKLFLHKMDEAADLDEAAVAERRPALNKLQRLSTFCDELTKKDRQEIMIHYDVLSVIKRWIQPLPNGQLGNVTVRQKLLDSLFKLENEITSNDLKRSELGKTVMVLAKHRSETPDLKRQWRKLIENWSRPIFQKSDNMRELSKVHRGTGGLASLAAQPGASERATRVKEEQDLNSMIVSGKKNTGKSASRVSVPFSKGFAYSVRPQGKMVEASPQKGNPSEIKTKLQKRMVEKGRTKSKNQRSANLSVEGRAVK